MINNLPEYVKLNNAYNPAHYPANKKISAEEWNALWLSVMYQGNHQEDVLASILNITIPENINNINNLINITDSHTSLLAGLRSDVDSAKETADNAETVALGIDAKATEALSNSETAVTTANEAKSIAENAESVANGIDAKATEALANSEYSVEIADEAKAIALSKTNNKSFDTYAEMIAYVSDVVNKEKHTVGSEFFIVEDYYSEYWVKEVLTTPNESGYYYVLQPSESTVWRVNGQTGEVVLNSDDISDTDKTNKWSTSEEKEKVSKIVTDGDGKKALLNNGEYGEVGTVDTVNNVLPDENKNITITADDIDDTSTTNKFATSEQLAQIATNTENIEDLQDDKVDKVYSTDYAYTDGLVFTFDTDHYYIGDMIITNGHGYTGVSANVIIPKFYDDGTHGIAKVTQIWESAFRDCTNLRSITIPNSVTSIWNSVFYGCTGLTSITIPDSVTNIGGYAFFDCTNLRSITIGNSVTSIWSSAFANCTGLTSVTIPNSVANIEFFAFYGCTGLTSITIPDGVTSIGEGAFAYCSSLTDITVLATTPPTLGDDAFLNSGITPATGAIYVPYESLTAYKTATDWSAYADIIYPIPEGKWITEDLDNAIANMATTQSYTATLPYTSWTGSSAPYSKEVTVNGILATDKPDFDLDLTSATYADIPTIQSAWFNVYKTVASADTITFYSHEIPSIDIPLLIKVVR